MPVVVPENCGNVQSVVRPGANVMMNCLTSPISAQSLWLTNYISILIACRMRQQDLQCCSVFGPKVSKGWTNNSIQRSDVNVLWKELSSLRMCPKRPSSLGFHFGLLKCHVGRPKNWDQSYTHCPWGKGTSVVASWRPLGIQHPFRRGRYMKIWIVKRWGCSAAKTKAKKQVIGHKNA